MVKAKKLKYNVKQKKGREEEFEFTPTTTSSATGKSINFEKLKKVLLDKGIISDISEIE